jgi:alpha-galactosidase
MPRIAFIGAGSTVFTRNLAGDVLELPDLADETTFALMDVDRGRLSTLLQAHGEAAAPVTGAAAYRMPL